MGNWFTADWVAAVGTVAAVVAALWLALRQEWIARRDRPVLDVAIRLCPPDCALDKQREILRYAITGRGSTEHEITIDAYWFRMHVHNSGKSPARDVEVTISDVTYRDDNHWVPYSAFLLSNLVWTHRQQESLLQLLPGTERHFDLGNVQRASDPKAMRFRFHLSVQPLSEYNVLTPGEYGFTITAGAANCRPVKRSFRLRFDGHWSQDWRQMFGDHVRVEPA